MLDRLPDHPAVRQTLEEVSAELGYDVRTLDSPEALRSTVPGPTRAPHRRRCRRPRFGSRRRDSRSCGRVVRGRIWGRRSCPGTKFGGRCSTSKTTRRIDGATLARRLRSHRHCRVERRPSRRSRQ